ncbi:type 4a pilus biogenesis protein PilO [Candidatus Omnitrophota bacterium]
MEAIDFINKYKNKIFNILLILTALLIARQIYGFQAKGMDSLQRQKSEQAEKNRLLKDVQAQELEFSFLKEALEKKDIALFINDINEIVKESGVRIISIKPLREKKEEEYTRYSFAIKVAARNYHFFGEFISRIEGSPDIFIVDKLNIKSAARAKTIGVQDKLHAEMIISTIFLKG